MAEISFGEWLKRQRKARGLTQEQLAQQVGCSTIALRKIEAEERRPSEQIAKRLAEIFHIPESEQAVFLLFARGQIEATPGANPLPSPWRAASSRANLPATYTSLIGREDEITAIHKYLQEPHTRLVTLVGPPGIGKTRLSLETARASLADFPDGVFFVPLAPLDDASLIAPTIAQVLGYVEASNVSVTELLTNGIGDKHILLVLDNCEHLIDSVASLAAGLLPSCPALTILTTSREALRVPGEWIYPVPALELPKETLSMDADSAVQFTALKLFAERARAVHPDFKLTAENIQAVASICVQLDGLPLAIELLASRMRSMSPQKLLERMTSEFVLSADGVRGVSARQKMLNNAIAWSYNALSTNERSLFARLSVFMGGFTMDAVEAAFSEFATDKLVADLVNSLADKSLLQRAIDARGESRYAMLVTIQSFAARRLKESGQDDEARNQHAAYFLQLAEEADKNVHGPNQIEWMDLLNVEFDNLHSALTWYFSSGQTRNLLRLFAALGWTWLVRWHPAESRNWLNKILSLPDRDHHPSFYARILNTAAHLEWIAANFGMARSFVDESREIWRELGRQGELGLAEALYVSGMIVRSQFREGDNKEAESYFEQSLNLFEKRQDKWGVAFTLFLLGDVMFYQEKEASSLEREEKSLELFQELGDLWGMARASQALGYLNLKLGNYNQARLYMEQQLRLEDELHFKHGYVAALTNLGDLYRYQADYDHAQQCYEKCISISREYGLKIDRGYNLYGLGMLALHRDDYSLAVRHFKEYFHTARVFMEKVSVCDFLIGMSAIASGLGQPKRSARLHGAAHALIESTDYRLQPFDLAEFERHILHARKQLGNESFETVAHEGRSMPVEQAIQYALTENL